MKLTLVAIEKSGFIRVAVEGHVTFPAANPAVNPLQDVLGPEWAHHRVLVSMARVSYVDSSAIGWLINCQRECRAKGGRLAIYAVPPAVKRTLDLLRLRELLNVTDSEAEALKLLRVPEAAIESTEPAEAR